MTPTVPNWKFWHPLPFWQMLAILTVAQLVSTFALVALREGGGIALPMWIAGGIGGGLGVVLVQWQARRARLKAAPDTTIE